ncbi:tonb-dependent outer membrane receptor precursor [Riemerella anatipestifer CH3]|uniref:Plug domain-containing protein n=1 Tax=Riemerella anatipestifer TaxID=34085 RepID=UPI0004DC3E15|nr:Plug domain-containing protein [Riemerella anatipestifer]AIH02392.1 tonb-dependent outer membrane receptor precursor [Riemerella anatipestifer CH3]
MKRLIIAISFICFGVANAQQQKQDSIEKEIQAVELKAQKKLIERKVDRLVFNVENAVSVVGGDALDALKATPSVRIQGNNIQLVGKSSVRVMINDKITQLSGEALQDYLKSIPSANILKIEVLPTHRQNMKPKEIVDLLTYNSNALNKITGVLHYALATYKPLTKD